MVKWQLDKLKGTTKYENHISIPKWIHYVIKPIFIDKLHLTNYSLNVCMVKPKIKIDV